MGRRTSEQLLNGQGVVVRSQTNRYNSQGWLTGADGATAYDAGGGASISQRLQTEYQFDAAGNRVRVRTEQGGFGVYSYDAAGRMLQGRDDKMGAGADNADQNINALVYDGFGNRVAETRDGQVTAYTYDALNRVRTSSSTNTSAPVGGLSITGGALYQLIVAQLAASGAFTQTEEWRYDVAGNTTFEKNRDGSSTTTTYDRANRATTTVSTATDGKTTTSTNSYDAVGNVVKTHVNGGDYRFDELTTRDLRYLEQSKTIANGWAKNTNGLRGDSSFQYDRNGQLTLVDRGRATGAGQNTVASFEYDLEGQIVGRADRVGALGAADLFAGYFTDPDAPVPNTDEYIWSPSPTVMQQLQQQYGSSSTQVQSHLYANNRPLAQAQGTQTVGLVKLSLVNVQAVYSQATYQNDLLIEGQLIGYTLTIAADQIVRTPQGQVDRQATAQRIAQAHYAGFFSLSEAGQAKVVSYLQNLLPAEVTAGTVLSTQGGLHNYIVLGQATMSGTTQITDYSIGRIGADGLPAGSIQSHVVRAGDSLQGIAQIYFGSPSYWYLIAEANRLQGHEPLQEGTTITIPNKVANAGNTAETFKVYNESEIIGSTSPEIRTIKKKKKWYQKLVQILIVVIMIVAAVITAGAALAIAGAATPGLLALGASLATSLGAVGLTGVAALGAAAAIGAGVYATANILSQGLAIAVDLQDGFEWKQVTKAAGTGAVAGAASFLGAGGWDSAGVAGKTAQGVDWLTRVGIEAGKQLIVDGKINNVAGLIGAAAGGGAFGGLGAEGSAVRAAGDWIGNNSGTFTAGLSILEGKIRGQGDNAMGWVGLATAALFDSGALDASDGTPASNAAGQPANRPGTPQYFDQAGQLNWKAIAVQAVGTAIVADRRGSDAGLSYLGNAVGEFVVQAGGRYMDKLAAQRQAQTRAMYGQDGTGDVISGHNGERLSTGPAAQQAPLSPAQRAAMAAGYGPVSAEQAEQLARQGLLNSPGATNAAQEGGSAFADDVARRKALSAFGIDPDTGLPRSPAPADPLSYKAKKGDGPLAVAAGMGAANPYAAVAHLYASEQVSYNKRVNRGITSEGQEYSYDPTQYTAEQIEQLDEIGRKIVSAEGNEDRRRQAVAEARTMAARMAAIREENRSRIGTGQLLINPATGKEDFSYSSQMQRQADDQRQTQTATALAAQTVSRADPSWGQQAQAEARGWTDTVIRNLDDAAVADNGGAVTMLASLVRTPARGFMAFVEGAVGAASLADSNVRQDLSNALGQVIEDPALIKRGAINYYNNHRWDEMLADGYVGVSSVLMGGSASKVTTGYLNKAPVLGADVSALAGKASALLRGTVAAEIVATRLDDAAPLAALEARGVGNAAGAGTLRQTGARQILDPNSTRSWDLVEDAYSAIRNDPTDIAAIARNTGWSESRVTRVKEHVFFREHQLDAGLKRFDADPDMLNSWSRLTQGDFVRSDINLLRKVCTSDPSMCIQ